jgi:divalent metal cation (Fe/Co/Zn/Cd) transporter
VVVAEVKSGLSGRMRGLLVLLAVAIGVGVGYITGNPLEGGLWGLIVGFLIMSLGRRGGG